MIRLLALLLLLFTVPASAQSLNGLVEAACVSHQTVTLSVDHVISEPITASCDGLIIDLGGTTLAYAGPQTDAVVDIRPGSTEPWRVNVTVKNGTIRSNGLAKYALRTWGVSHSIFENLRLRDVTITGYLGQSGVTNHYRMISCSANEKPFETVPQSCFIASADGPYGFGLWASHLDTIIAEGLSGAGISLSVSSYNVLTAGTSEKNAVGLVINGDGNLIQNLDLEENSIANKTITGAGNIFTGFPS